MKHTLIILLLYLISSEGIRAQIGGKYTYDFLNLSPAPRVTALGGVNISTLDDDLNMGYQNPALVNDSMHHRITLSYTDYLADIHFGYAGYSRSWKGIGSFHVGMNYVNYGTMQETDPFGTILGEFTAGEWAFVAGGASAVGPFRYGAHLKVVHSRLAEEFSSWGIATDIGAAFLHPNKLFTAGVVVRNAGVQLSTYVDEASREPLPLQVIVGISNKLKYMPLRLSVTAIHLENPTLVQVDPNAPPEFDLNGEIIDQEPAFSDKIFRHLVFGGEFLLGNAMRLRAGYNHMRRQELRSENRGGLTGFSFGVGIRINRFMIDYGYASYGINSLFNTNQFGINIDLNQALKNKNKEKQLNRKENI